MNNKLKNSIKNYIDNGVIEEFTISIEEITKALNSDINKDMDCLLNVDVTYVTNGYLFDQNIYHYFDLDEDNNLTFNIENYLKPIDAVIKDDFLNNWVNGKDCKRVVITHKNCQDGAGVAAVVKYHNETILKDNNINCDIEYLYVDYGSFDFEELMVSLKDKLVYVGDFSFTYEQLERLLTVVEDIIIVDHHKIVNENPLGNHPNVHGDQTKSGTLLAWEFFFGEQLPMYIVELISDRDLWNFFYGDDTRALQLMLSKKGFDTMGDYMSEDHEVSYVKLVDDLSPYVEELALIDKKNIARANQAIPYNINGIIFYGLNLTSGVSDVLNHVSKIYGTPSLGYWIDNATNTLQLSFRNETDNIDVALVANTFGGGGHKQAAGAKISLEHVSPYLLMDFFRHKKLMVGTY